MDLLRSLLVPREAMDLPSLEELQRQQEESMAMMEQSENPPSRAPIQPLVTRFAGSEETAPVPTSKPYQTMTLEEYTAQAQAQQAELLKTNPDAFDRNGKFIIKKQTQKQQPPRAAPTNKSAVQPVSIEPVALGKPRTSDNTIALHHLVQKHNIPLPKFTWSESGTKGAGTFSIKIEILIPFPPSAGPEKAGSVSHAIEWTDPGPYRSKKEAKEGISEQALKVIQDEVDKMQKAQQEAQETMVDSIPDVDMQEQASQIVSKPVEEPQENKENAVGLLLEFCTATSLPQPQYQLYSVGIQSFACELTVQYPAPTPNQEQDQSQPEEADASDPASSLEDGEIGDQTTDEDATMTESDTAPSTEPAPLTTQVFGSKTQAHPSKKAAKMSAAQLAIAHLRSFDLLPSQGAPPPRKRERIASSAADDGFTTPPLTSDHGSSSAGNSFTSSSSPTQSSNGTKPTQSYVSRAHHLRETLGLGNLEYRLINTPGTAFYKGSAFFPQGGGKKGGLEGLLRGDVGVLREEVFGKKAAKEEIARGVVEVLEGERRRRGLRVRG